MSFFFWLFLSDKSMFKTIKTNPFKGWSAWKKWRASLRLCEQRKGHKKSKL